MEYLFTFKKDMEKLAHASAAVVHRARNDRKGKSVQRMNRENTAYQPLMVIVLSLEQSAGTPSRSNAFISRIPAKILAKNINSEVIPDMVIGQDSGHFHVKSCIKDVQYDMYVKNNQMNSCTCRDYEYKRIASKHMYPLSRLHTHIAPVQVTLEYGATLEEREEEESVAVDEAVTNGDNLSNLMTNMLAQFRAYRESPHLLNESDVAIATEAISMLSDVIRKSINDQEAPNRKLSTQRQ